MFINFLKVAAVSYLEIVISTKIVSSQCNYVQAITSLNYFILKLGIKRIIIKQKKTISIKVSEILLLLFS